MSVLRLPLVPHACPQARSPGQNCTLTWLPIGSLRADDDPTRRRCVHVVNGVRSERNLRSNAFIEHSNYGTPVARPTIVSAATAAQFAFFRRNSEATVTVSLFADTSVSPAPSWHEVQLVIPEPERPYICWCQCNRQPTYPGDTTFLESRDRVHALQHKAVNGRIYIFCIRNAHS